MTVKIITENTEKIYTYDQSVKVSEVLRDAGIDFDMPCGGIGRCLKCLVKVTGSLSKMSEREEQLLSEIGNPQNIRYACMTYITDDAVIYYNTSQTALQGVSDGNMPSFEKDIFLNKNEVGISVDIGTTTIAVRLWNLADSKVLSSAVEKNEQITFGSDVISRISCAIEGKTDLMRESVVSQINRIIENESEKNRIDVSNVARMCVTGNTTMLHLLTGISPEKMGAFPFEPDEYFGKTVPSQELGLNVNCDVYLAPCISGFVGGDIVSGMLSSEIYQDEKAVFVDIGTNGEIVMVSPQGLSCSSTAAGPAFEGGNIECGSPAIDGAICKVWTKDGKICYETINNKEAKSICGSGIIDLVAVLIDEGIIDETGFMYEGEKEEFKFDDCNVRLTQKDIRQLQLAKSAIASGIKTIIHENGLNEEDIDSFYVAGGFSKFINYENACKIGLISKAFKGKIKILGNSALTGCDMMLLSEKMRQKAEKLKNSTKNIELSTNTYFMDEYVNNMSF